VRAMVLEATETPLVLRETQDPVPGGADILVRVAACGVCRTDLHVVDGELSQARLPIVPGHEIVGYVESLGPEARDVTPGMRVGIPWLGSTCGRCSYCIAGRENLCDRPEFTGCTRDGGFATHVLADSRYLFQLPPGDDVAMAPLLCAGLIGWRSLRIAGEGRRLGIYGFGAAAHIVTQIAHQQGREVFAFTRAGDVESQQFARELGARWAGSSDEHSPVELDCAIIYAPAGPLVPAALASVRKGGRVVCAGIHMSDIPSFPYVLLWGEREIVSVANLTRQDGCDFFSMMTKIPIVTSTTAYPLAGTNEALADLRSGKVQGAAVIVP
jgi:propanol-preferring alcohol dehydrogenase